MMKNIILFLLLIFSASAFGQTTLYTAGITYTNGAPTHNPGTTGAKYAIDTVTWDLYVRSYGTSWTKAGDLLQQTTGCVPPAYTPTKFQSNFVINACDSLYWYNGASWDHLNAGGGGGGITGTGLANRLTYWTDAGAVGFESTMRIDTTNNRLILGSQTVAPARTLHVEGEARISDLTTDTPTRLVGADADGDLGEVALSGLSMVGGTLTNSNTGTVTGTGASPRLAYWNGASSITSHDSIVMSTTGPDRVSIGQPTAFAPRLYVEGSGTTSSTIGLLVAPQNSAATSASLVVLDNGFIGSGLINPSRDLQIQRSSASSVRASLTNTNTSAGFTVFQMQTGASAGDPHVFVGVSGSATAGWAFGLDNSDSDKFKICRSPGDVNQITNANAALIINENKDVGIRQNTPTSALHIIGEGATSTKSSFRAGTSLDSVVIFARNDRRVGINTATPDVSLDAGDNTDGIKLPSGASIDRKSVNNVLRNNTDAEGLEYRENGNWYRLTSSKSPSAAVGAGAGTGALIGITGSDLAGEISIVTGTGAAAGQLFTITYGNSFAINSNFYVTFSCRNANCTGLQLYVSANSQNSFTISSNNAPASSTTYDINYHVGQ
jgi:hypothetical protein